jgi:phosphate transport system permease protein
MSSAAIAKQVQRRSLTGQGTDWRGLIFQALLGLALLFTLAILVVLLVDVVLRSLPVFTERGVDFLTSETSGRPARAGVVQGIQGSLLIVLIVAVTAIPIGIMTAIYLEEYARDDRLTRFISVNIRNLAGVPSIVYGLLGLALFVGLFKGLGLGPSGSGRIVFAGGLTMATLVLPIVIITATEALRAVPNAIREAGYGVGASRWQVSRQLVLPAALPGILTGIVLSLARALGETAPLLLAGAVLGSYSSGGRDFLGELSGAYTALPMVIFNWTKESAPEFRELAAAGIVVLLVVTLLANTLAVILRNRFERSW